MTPIEKEFLSITKEYEQDDKNREKLIGISREILKPSKQAIYATHREDFDRAKQLLATAKKNIDQAAKIDLKVGALHAAIEEYVEAYCFYLFVTEEKIPTRADLDILPLKYETYLGALSDFTGELARLAVISATRKNINKVQTIYKTVDSLHGLFLQFDFRTGELRKKYDSIKYNVKKVESIVYDMSK